MSHAYFYSSPSSGAPSRVATAKPRRTPREDNTTHSQQQQHQHQHQHQRVGCSTSTSNNTSSSAVAYIVYSPQGPRPLESITVVSATGGDGGGTPRGRAAGGAKTAPTGVRGVYDSITRSQLLCIPAGTTVAFLSNGDDTTNNNSNRNQKAAGGGSGRRHAQLPLSAPQRVLVLQVFPQAPLSSGGQLSVELSLKDRVGTRRLLFTSVVKEMQVHAQHAKVPIGGVLQLRSDRTLGEGNEDEDEKEEEEGPRWINFYFDLGALHAACFATHGQPQSAAGAVGGGFRLAQVKVQAQGMDVYVRRLLAMHHLPAPDTCALVVCEGDEGDWPQQPESLRLPDGVPYASVFIRDGREKVLRPASSSSAAKPPPSSRRSGGPQGRPPTAATSVNNSAIGNNTPRSTPAAVGVPMVAVPAAADNYVQPQRGTPRTGGSAREKPPAAPPLPARAGADENRLNNRPHNHHQQAPTKTALHHREDVNSRHSEPRGPPQQQQQQQPPLSPPGRPTAVWKEPLAARLDQADARRVVPLSLRPPSSTAAEAVSPMAQHRRQTSMVEVSALTQEEEVESIDAATQDGDDAYDSYAYEGRYLRPPPSLPTASHSLGRQEYYAEAEAEAGGGSSNSRVLSSKPASVYDTSARLGTAESFSSSSIRRVNPPTTATASITTTTTNEAMYPSTPPAESYNTSSRWVPPTTATSIAHTDVVTHPPPLSVGSHAPPHVEERVSDKAAAAAPPTATYAGALQLMEVMKERMTRIQEVLQNGDGGRSEDALRLMRLHHRASARPTAAAINKNTTTRGAATPPKVWSAPHSQQIVHSAAPTQSVETTTTPPQPTRTMEVWATAAAPATTDTKNTATGTGHANTNTTTVSVSPWSPRSHPLVPAEDTAPATAAPPAAPPAAAPSSGLMNQPPPPDPTRPSIAVDSSTESARAREEVVRASLDSWLHSQELWQQSTNHDSRHHRHSHSHSRSRSGRAPTREHRSQQRAAGDSIGGGDPALPPTREADRLVFDSGQFEVAGSYDKTWAVCAPPAAEAAVVSQSALMQPTSTCSSWTFKSSAVVDTRREDDESRAPSTVMMAGACASSAAVRTPDPAAPLAYQTQTAGSGVPTAPATRGWTVSSLGRAADVAAGAGAGAGAGGGGAAAGGGSSKRPPGLPLTPVRSGSQPTAAVTTGGCAPPSIQLSQALLSNTANNTPELRHVPPPPPPPPPPVSRAEGGGDAYTPAASSAVSDGFFFLARSDMPLSALARVRYTHTASVEDDEWTSASLRRPEESSVPAEPHQQQQQQQQQDSARDSSRFVYDPVLRCYLDLEANAYVGEDTEILDSR